MFRETLHVYQGLFKSFKRNDTEAVHRNLLIRNFEDELGGLVRDHVFLSELDESLSVLRKLPSGSLVLPGSTVERTLGLWEEATLVSGSVWTLVVVVSIVDNPTTDRGNIRSTHGKNTARTED
ncbi:hypothetical protein BaRGS_00023203 [Batillaria attramentaria]|uniref:Uncharacterized protein n=1 Tax=Batillaria attramentaria TaxID=370345 RepID=A0ABD0KEN0_9CAEN